ncbi:hypothetical protein LB505_013924 [Fusarium chuoi]|nr:hypothetical protein LB505_013924 [Fusarium chuoi]
MCQSTRGKESISIPHFPLEPCRTLSLIWMLKYLDGNTNYSRFPTDQTQGSTFLSGRITWLLMLLLALLLVRPLALLRKVKTNMVSSKLLIPAANL